MSLSMHAGSIASRAYPVERVNVSLNVDATTISPRSRMIGPRIHASETGTSPNVSCRSSMIPVLESRGNVFVLGVPESRIHSPLRYPSAKTP